MTTSRRKTPSPHDPLSAVKRRKAVPHEFVLEALAALSPHTRSMFGCLAVYVEDKIVLILRDRRDATADNGVWLAPPKITTRACAAPSPTCGPFRYFRKTCGLAGASGRRPGFRGVGTHRLRADRRQGSSNRQGAGGAASLGIEADRASPPEELVRVSIGILLEVWKEAGLH
jgi:hypothetical protein